MIVIKLGDRCDLMMDLSIERTTGCLSKLCDGSVTKSAPVDPLPPLYSFLEQKEDYLRMESKHHSMRFHVDETASMRDSWVDIAVLQCFPATAFAFALCAITKGSSKFHFALGLPSSLCCKDPAINIATPRLVPPSEELPSMTTSMDEQSASICRQRELPWSAFPLATRMPWLELCSSARYKQPTTSNSFTTQPSLKITDSR